MSSNVVAEVQAHCVAAVKSKSTTVQAPSKWATEAGFQGSAAGPLREHIARASDNGCGRDKRYPKVDAEGMLELIELGYAYKAAEDNKKAALAKRIGVRVRPAQAGAKQAKGQAKRAPRKAKSKSAA